MESIFKTGLYIALSIVQILIFIMLYCKYMEAKCLREVVGDLEAELDENIKDFSNTKQDLLQEVEDWKRKAVTPLENFPTPVVFERAEVKPWVAKTELEQEWGTNKIRPGQVERATQEFLNSIRPFIYSELVRENGRAVYYQEIFISKPNKLHYEKQS